MKGQRFDIHQHITDQIIAAIESGAGEFRLPWHRSPGNIMRPVNIASKNAYRGAANAGYDPRRLLGPFPPLRSRLDPVKRRERSENICVRPLLVATK